MVFHQSRHQGRRTPAAGAPPDPERTRFFSVFRFSGRALGLVWQTSRGLTLTIGALTLVAGLLPAGVAYVGKWIVDGALAAMEGRAEAASLIGWIALECTLVAALAGAQRALDVCQSLLRAQLGQRVNVIILEKALRMELAQFEDSEFYDRLTRARREASSRPLSLVMRTFGLIQNLIALLSYGGLLLAFSPLAVLVLVLAGLPAFVAETRFSGEAFRLFRWRAPETRKRAYLEMALAREDFAKEVKIFDLGPLFLQRYRQIFNDLYQEDRNLTLRRGFWGYVLGLLGTLSLYGAYAWIGWSAVQGALTIGSMTMYFLVFKQGQSAFSAGLSAVGGMFEDNLYLSNLYEFLEEPDALPAGSAKVGPKPGDGVRFEDVWFTYPGAGEPALCGINLHLKPGQKLALVGENGSGKTTLIKLLTRLYEVERGRILLDGLALCDWDRGRLRERIGVIFQDFVRYQMSVGENIGAGDVTAFADRDRWQTAAERGLAAELIDRLPDGYDTQLGRWFHKGQELSGGQWQKIAVARALMRREADILVLDEPTAALDAEAEARIFEQFREMTQDRMAILISHRFSTVRQADLIVVLRRGRVMEQGDHATLIQLDGDYARLFKLQAKGYQ
ncbi:ABC transporter ATP-binding protein [Acanthopleuribacter pedis]|uniref:ABC transporter ATP-binding protein n=1 Tax=Acanthopleuribacter pedis TaxID=442870 RepID=A0A8J7QC92_9BACT|nr:ABC transporter ATP-binding protein [Acanthopleuribacter pedis]MBO1321792.1 ABC transporter ATP-binding protein [Acanthopleuribacter pedis]